MNMFDKPLFIFEMANNHQGDVAHGKKIIHALREASKDYMEEFHFAVKFQYRDLDTFLHPAYRGRLDLKNVKRFQETRLDGPAFEELKREAEGCGFFTICTPFDEVSAERIWEQGFDAIKIASCSFTDWPLLEKIAEHTMPVIASTAGSSMDDIKRVALFFENRKTPLSLMHCVAEYPTPEEKLQMNQIDLLRRAFPDHAIGFSTHEPPEDAAPVMLAVAKGARIFEKHVGLPTEEISLNAYSANPGQVKAWLEEARRAFGMCGVSGERYAPSQKEQEDLSALSRGIFAKGPMQEGETLSEENVYFAFPCVPGQLLAKDFSKYSHIALKSEKSADDAIMREDAQADDAREKTEKIIEQIAKLLRESNVVIPEGSKCEISHHYGLSRYQETGVAIIECINREYCKKILALLPGQNHPVHLHKKKEETFSVVYGDLHLALDGEQMELSPGESMVVERNVKHSFFTEHGCVFEEISTTHFKNDSYYEDESRFVQPRKTTIYLSKSIFR